MSNNKTHRKCPKCGFKLNIGLLLRAKPASWKQREASRLNGLSGGRPIGGLSRKLYRSKPKHVYKIICPVTERIMYVGVSCQPAKRQYGHFKPFAKIQSPVSIWIKKLWAEHRKLPKFKTSKKSYPIAEALRREAYLIRFYQLTGQCSLNSPEKRYPNEPAFSDDTSF